MSLEAPALRQSAGVPSAGRQKKIRPRLLFFLLRTDLHSHSLSFQVLVREHMLALIPEDQWLQDTIHPDELNAWDPAMGPCCTPGEFKLNLAGTPRNDWNISASRVFTDHFLVTHAATYTDDWENRELVLRKTQAHIKTLVRSYRQQFVGADVIQQRKVALRRRERKSKVSCCPVLP